MENIKIENIKLLSFDIILKIISYTYQYQKKSLLDDIKNYTKSKKILLELYHKFWIIERTSTNSDEDKEWLINDIFGFANNQYPLMFGYTDKFLSIFSRNTFLKNNEKIKIYVDKLETKNILTQINIFLGLLNLEERNNIISNFCIKNNINID